MPAIPSARLQPLHFTAVVTSATGPADQGHWHRSRARWADFDDLERQVRLARTLERGKFDAVLFPDAAGPVGRWPSDERGPAEGGFPAPTGDPAVLAGAVAYVTSHIGIVLTVSAAQDDPASFARRVSALDHASAGRIGWNIAGDPPDAWTEEFVDVTYKLWEGSWDEDAIRADSRADRQGWAGKVHRINHRGPRYQVTGPHLVSPTPQRTPVLVRAGTAEADRAFAAANAEAVFIHAPSLAAAARAAADTRSRAVSHGRRPEDVKVFRGLRVVTGGTEAEARRKAAELDERAGTAGSRPFTPGTARITGTPEQVADELASWADAGIDGVSLEHAGGPGPHEEFVDHVAPVLRERGLMQREYAEGPLRHKLFGQGGRLPATHPAARYRGAFAPQPALIPW